MNPFPFLLLGFEPSLIKKLRSMIQNHIKLWIITSPGEVHLVSPNDVKSLPRPYESCVMFKFLGSVRNA